MNIKKDEKKKRKPPPRRVRQGYQDLIHQSKKLYHFKGKEKKEAFHILEWKGGRIRLKRVLP